MGKNVIADLRLYVTHIWEQKSEGDFAGLAGRLKGAGLDTVFDSIEIGPCDLLWDRVSVRLSSAGIMGWAYVLTPRSLGNMRCREELFFALERAFKNHGAEFPLIGLLHGVAAQELPLLLRSRQCIHLADPDWPQKVKACFTRSAAGDESRFLWRIHEGYGGSSSATAIEVCPRAAGVRYWRFAVPSSIRPIRWGHGRSGGGDVSPFLFSVVKGAGRIGNSDIIWFGSEDCLSQAESAYAVFDGMLPSFICFGEGKDPSGPPEKMEMFHTDLTRPDAASPNMRPRSHSYFF